MTTSDNENTKDSGKDGCRVNTVIYQYISTDIIQYANISVWSSGLVQSLLALTGQHISVVFE